MRTLRNFPDQFYPLAIVVGDRREEHAKTRGDLLAYSGSVADLMYSHGLGLRKDVEIVSDKSFVLSDQNYLRNRFGTLNLLVIGSPAANLLSRIVNSSSLFRFNISTEAKKQLAEQEAIINKYPFDPRWLQIYKDVSVGLPFEKCLDRLRSRREATPTSEIRVLYDRLKGLYEQTGLANLKALQQQFAVSGFIDPIDDEVHGIAMRPDRDFGIVSIARNPYSQNGENVAILVAGVHAPATVHGVRTLGDREQFEQYPLGGVFELDINTDAGWPDRLRSENVIFRWQTQPYNVQNIFRHLKRATKLAAHDKQQLLDLLHPLSHRDAPNAPTAFLSVKLDKTPKQKKVRYQQAQKIVRTIEEGVAQALPHLKCLNPYEILTHGINYVTDILAIFEQASFVVHDITGFSTGVMVEVGVSIGLKKRMMLFWDTSLQPFPELPRLLKLPQIHHIEDPSSRPGGKRLARLLPRLVDGPAATTRLAAPTPRQVHVYATAHRQIQCERTIAELSSNGYSPVLAENDIALERVRAMVEESSAVVVLFEGTDIDALITLGIARAMRRVIMLLVHDSSNAPSMSDAKVIRWHEKTFDTVIRQAMPELVSAMQRASAGRSRGAAGGPAVVRESRDRSSPRQLKVLP